MAGSDYYNHTTYPSTGASGSSSAMRAELERIEAGFGKLPDLAANPGELVVVNAGGTALETIAAGLTTEMPVGGGAGTPPVWTTATGSGAPVRATSPTITSASLVTPTLGVATATSINKVALTAPATSATLTIADGKTLSASNSLTLAGTDSTTLTMPPETSSVGYMNIPQQSKSTAYTLVLTDAGKHILHPSADTTARTMTIPANSSVAFPVGTAVTFINQNSAGVMTIAITTDTMRLAGPGTTGSRTLAANGMATAVKVTATEWIISGTGLS